MICDAASSRGGAAILAQLDDRGRERPVAFFSRRWSCSEKHWAPIEHECATVRDAIKHFNQYLAGRHFTVITDAEALVWLKSVRYPKGRLAAWIMEIQMHDFAVIHRPGAENRNVDALSRHDPSLDPHHINA